MRATLSNDLLRRYVTSLGYRCEPGRLHIAGIRGVVPVRPTAAERRIGPSVVEARPNVPDHYNDTVVVFGSAWGCYLASVDPGETGTQNPSNPNGCAHLLNGQWRYQVGRHRGKPALVQAAAVKVWRDRDKDHRRDPHELTDEGWFGINLHAGGLALRVGPNSHGCQVLWGGWEGPWTEFYDQVEQAQQEEYLYSLFDGDAFLRFAAKGGR